MSAQLWNILGVGAVLVSLLLMATVLVVDIAHDWWRNVRRP